VLITSTARKLNPGVHIVATARVNENLHLLEQSGADAVIDTSSAVGRLVGLASRAPSALHLVEAGSDLELVEVRPVVDADGLVRPLTFFVGLEQDSWLTARHGGQG